VIVRASQVWPPSQAGLSSTSAYIVDRLTPQPFLRGDPAMEPLDQISRAGMVRGSGIRSNVFSAPAETFPSM
jgi:hypothetical protein